MKEEKQVQKDVQKLQRKGMRKRNGGGKEKEEMTEDAMEEADMVEMEDEKSNRRERLSCQTGTGSVYL